MKDKEITLIARLTNKIINIQLVRAPDCMSYLCVEGIPDGPARDFPVSLPYNACTAEP